LDEIANMPLGQQGKLLRAIETGDVERVGSSKTRHVDVRIVSATNADVRQAVRAGQFREDLLFRLNTVEIQLPPLRERPEDIPALAHHFLGLHAQRYGKALKGIDPGAIQALLDHPWPGNVRELDHALERGVLLARGDVLMVGDLGLKAADGEPSQPWERMTLEDAERFLIQRALQRADGNVSDAAKQLGLSRSALYRRLQYYGLKTPG
jgi:DNA-binding NtrC family response regulator